MLWLQTVEEKMKRREESPDEKMEALAAKRELRVWFQSTVADDMPWKFVPTQPFVRVKPGQSTLIFFTATNLSDKPITGALVRGGGPAHGSCLLLVLVSVEAWWGGCVAGV